MIKIIYLDIDGTLRDERQGIPGSAVWALEQCRRREIRIVICTGRNTGSIQNDVLALCTDGMISGGGCYIQYQGKNILQKHFSKKVLKKVMLEAQELRLSLALEAERKIYMDHNAAAFYQKDFQHKICGGSKADQKMLRINNKIAYEENFKDMKSDAPQIHKICILGQQAAIEQVERDVKQNAETVQKKKWDDHWYLELLPKGCDKGSAVQTLNRMLGISRGESMSFGDSDNDIAMMEATGTAVAVGCGNPVLGAYAASVCEPVMEDGIYKELLRRNIIDFYGSVERRDKYGKAMVAGRSCVSDLSEKLL